MTMKKQFHVIHPIHDTPEEKLTGEGLSHITMTPAVRYSLIVLRLYLITMFVLVVYHVADMTGLFK